MEAIHSWAETLLGLSLRPQQMGVIQIGLRAVIVYLVMILFVRLGKKRFLGRATAFDAILMIIIGSTAARAITGNAPFLSTLAGVLVLIAMHWIISLTSRHSPSLSVLVKGESTRIIRDGRVDDRALRKEHMSRDDLEEDLRQEGVETPSAVRHAYLERSGRLSVIKRQ
jgi:uncharacterized membrane protein YcaP (DUF421 family)